MQTLNFQIEIYQQDLFIKCSLNQITIQDYKLKITYLANNDVISPLKISVGDFSCSGSSN